MRLARLFGAAATVMTLATSGAAWACSPSGCTGGLVRPNIGAAIPANVTTYYVSPARGGGYGVDAGDPSGSIALLDANGAAVPFMLTPDSGGGYLVKPASPLAPGSYTLRRVDSCP